MPVGLGARLRCWPARFRRPRKTGKSPTPEEYVAHVGGEAEIVPPGEFELDGIKLYCGTRPTVIDNKLDDYGAAYPASSS